MYSPPSSLYLEHHDKAPPIPDYHLSIRPLQISTYLSRVNDHTTASTEHTMILEVPTVLLLTYPGHSASRPGLQSMLLYDWAGRFSEDATNAGEKVITSQGMLGIVQCSTFSVDPGNLLRIQYRLETGSMLEMLFVTQLIESSEPGRTSGASTNAMGSFTFTYTVEFRPTLHAMLRVTEKIDLFSSSKPQIARYSIEISSA
ncbi:hypothetical protein Hypma_014023 [Hypsizygus marmoreus]|uniref:Uncharacterized protein n=1 Tax=Hypsizygus marmoreus TaxID=39966 RepID=A0A369K634_HYPMA|nr:hypothetical protein Hypma_014023 [Hypsizygus marmoreus]